MYTGAALMSTPYWLPAPPNEVLFFVTQGIFFTCLIIAAYLQEKETLARFGEEAKDYYRVTPRLFFYYPFLRFS
jgi:protein-S-isoprenylcysteine O-methyltransferase Ste14